MNERQFITRLRKLLGRNAAYRLNPAAPDAEERAGYQSVLPELRAAESEALAAMRARRAELLADPVYVSLVEKWTAAKRLADNALGKRYSYRVTAGVASGIGLHVKAEGDTLQDVIENLERRREAA